MTNSPVPPDRPHIYAFSTKRLVLLSSMVVLLIALGLMLGIRIEREQQARAIVSNVAPAARKISAAPSGLDKKPGKSESPAVASKKAEPAATKPATAKTDSKTAKTAAAKSKRASKPIAAPTAIKKASPKKVKPAPKQVAPSKPAVAKPAAPAPRRGHYAVQVGSSQDKSKAALQIETLKKNEFAAYLETANLGDKGTYYRVMIGPFQTKARAKEAQSSLARDSRFTNSLIRYIP